MGNEHRKAPREGSCTYLRAELGSAVLHGAELLERRSRWRRMSNTRWRRSLVEVQARWFTHLLQGSVCKCKPEVRAPKLSVIRRV